MIPDYSSIKWRRKRLARDKRPIVCFLIAAAFCIPIVYIICAICWSFFVAADTHRREHRAAQWDAFAIQVKNVAVIMKQYAANNGGQYPDSISKLVMTGYPIMPNNTYIDPEAPLGNHVSSQPSIINNGHNAGGILGSLIYVGYGATLSSPPQTVLLCEPNWLGSNKVWVLFIDGRTELYDSLKAARATTSILGDDRPDLTQKLVWTSNVGNLTSQSQRANTQGSR